MRQKLFLFSMIFVVILIYVVFLSKEEKKVPLLEDSEVSSPVSVLRNSDENDENENVVDTVGKAVSHSREFEETINTDQNDHGGSFKVGDFKVDISEMTLSQVLPDGTAQYRHPEMGIVTITSEGEILYLPNEI